MHANMSRMEDERRKREDDPNTVLTDPQNLSHMAHRLKVKQQHRHHHRHHHHRSKPKVPSPLGAHVKSSPQLTILSDVAVAAAKVDGDIANRKRKRDNSLDDDVGEADQDIRTRDEQVIDLRNRLLIAETRLTQTQERLEEAEKVLAERARENDNMAGRLNRAERVQAKAIKHAADAALYGIISRICAGDEATASMMTTDLILKMQEHFSIGTNVLLKELITRRSTASSGSTKSSTPIARLLTECKPVSQEEENSTQESTNPNPKVKELVSKLRQRMATEPARPITKWGAFKAAGTIRKK